MPRPRIYREVIVLESYETECLIGLLVRNPNTLFAYWVIGSSYKQLLSEYFQCPWSSMQAWISVHDVTELDYDGYTDYGSVFIPIAGEGCQTYIHPVRAGREYIADFRLRTEGGEPFVLMRSRRVQTPPGSVKIPHWPISQVVISKQSSPSSSKRPYPDVFDGYGVISSHETGRDVGR